MKIPFTVLFLSILLQGCGPVHLYDHTSPHNQTYTSSSSYSTYNNSTVQLNDELTRLNYELSRARKKKEKDNLRMRIKEQKRIIEQQRKFCEQLENDRQRKLENERAFQARERQIQQERYNQDRHYTMIEQNRRNDELNRLKNEERDLQLAINNSKKTFAEEDQRRRLQLQQEERDLQMAIENSKKTFAEESTKHQNKNNIEPSQPLFATAPAESITPRTFESPSVTTPRILDPKRPGSSYTSQELGRAGALMQGSGQSRDAYLQKLEVVFSKERATRLLDDIINGEDNASE
ncbi:MAG: hypothetical protein HEEMFOPI_00980 [Holosporales bacterium]